MTAIIWPTIALVIHIYAVWLVMYASRMRHMRAHPPTPDVLESTVAFLNYEAPVAMPSNNLRNLFEMPVLYFALVPLLLLTGLVTTAQLVLAWGYVGLRVAHSAIHIGKGPVVARFLVYALSCALLLAMWIGLAVDLATRR